MSSLFFNSSCLPVIIIRVIPLIETGDWSFNSCLYCEILFNPYLYTHQNNNFIVLAITKLCEQNVLLLLLGFFALFYCYYFFYINTLSSR